MKSRTARESPILASVAYEVRGARERGVRRGSGSRWNEDDRVVRMCEKCKKVQATFHLTNIKPSGEKTALHLCDRCAVEEGYVQKAAVPIQELLTSFLASKTAVAEVGELTCEHCGMTFVEFRNHGLLGCAHDYEVFRKPLAQMLEKAQDGATHHVGKRPRARGGAAGAQRPTAAEVRKMKKQLEEAVKAEDYERAVELRDRIRELEGA